MPEDKDMPPTLRVEMPDGVVFYPKFVKNTQGESIMKDAEFWRPYIALQDSRRQSKKEKA